APRYQVAADELQEARELRVAGRLGDGAVKADVLLDRAALGGDRLVERVQRGADGAHLGLARALRHEARGLDLDAQAQLHHTDDVGERAQLLRLDAKRRPLRPPRQLYDD